MSLKRKLEIQSMLFPEFVVLHPSSVGYYLPLSETHTAGMTFSYIVIKRSST
jgi:hypothetical protein